MEGLCPKLDYSKICGVREEIVLGQVTKERRDIFVECSDVGSRQPGEDGLTVSIGARVERAMQQLAYEQLTEKVVVAYNCVPFKSYVPLGAVDVDPLEPMGFAYPYCPIQTITSNSGEVVLLDIVGFGSKNMSRTTSADAGPMADSSPSELSLGVIDQDTSKVKDDRFESWTGS
jgi:hypothetical protein